MNIEIIVDNARKGDYNAILQLKQISANEFNPYADKVLESIYFDGNKNHAAGIIVLREGIKNIQPEEFKNCTKIMQVILPDSLISIGDGAFEGCFRLEKVFFPDNLKSIGKRAFFGCKSLEKIILPDNVKIGTDAFAGCNQNVSQPQPVQQNFSQPVQQKKIVYYDGKKSHAVGTIYLREGITSIKAHEFENFNRLEKIILPEGLISIGDWAFAGCENLTEIKFPESLKSIGEWAFRGCSSLKELLLPDGLTEIGYSAFFGCISLTEIEFPKRLTSIDDWAFFGCTSLKKITYYKTTEYILKKCFAKEWYNLAKNMI